MKTASNKPAHPWYREFWAWFVLAIPALGVASGVAMIVISLHNAPQEITGDHQRLGKTTVATGSMSGAAQALGLAGRLSVGNGRVELLLDADRPESLPSNLLLRFDHPVDARFDTSVVLERRDTRRWVADLTDQPPSRARVILTDPMRKWGLAGRYEGPVEGSIALDHRQL